MEKIDITFDFTTDTPHYWDNFWQNRDGLGFGNADPDSQSLMLRKYHRILWSKELPNGEKMELHESSRDYLTWKNFRFGSDSITTGFRYKILRDILNELRNTTPEYEKFQENFIRHGYTIGGMIIFPKMRNSINQLRGTNPKIRDRIDLTLECIRRYYENKQSPLTEVLERNSDFFNLFLDFKGYIDFFFLQDLVSTDYKSINFMLGFGDLNKNPLPKDIQEWHQWYNNTKKFVTSRNQRIINSLH